MVQSFLLSIFTILESSGPSYVLVEVLGTLTLALHSTVTNSFKRKAHESAPDHVERKCSTGVQLALSRVHSDGWQNIIVEKMPEVSNPWVISVITTVLCVITVWQTSKATVSLRQYARWRVARDSTSLESPPSPEICHMPSLRLSDWLEGAVGVARCQVMVKRSIGSTHFWKKSIEETERSRCQHFATQLLGRARDKHKYKSYWPES